MKIRRDQFEAMRRPPWEPRRKLRDALVAQGHEASLDAKTGDLLLKTTGPGTTRIRFGDDGRVSTIEEPDGKVSRVELDEKGRVISLTDQAGGNTRLRYEDPAGRITGMTDPRGFRRDVVYRNDRPVEIRRYNRAPIGIGWTPAGDLESLRDGRGASLRFGYGPNHEITRLTERGGAETSYRYSAGGHLEELRTPRGAVWRFQEDEAAGTGSVVRPDGTHIDRAPLGPSKDQIVRADGSRVIISRDEAGRPAQVKYADGSVVTLGWASEGRLAEADNGRHKVRFQYDQAGRCTEEDVDGARLTCRYDEQGHLVGMKLPSGESLSFVSGPGGRVSEVKDWDGNRYAIQWSPGGDLTGIQYPGPVREAMHPLPSGQLDFQELWTKGPRIARRYSYDANDLVETIEDSVHGVKTHEFDADDRLVSVSSPLGKATYAYDDDGNLRAAGARRFEYDALDRITEGTGVRCRCDTLGNLVDWEDEKGRTLFRYNGQGQLVRADLPGGQSVEYEYDALGRRLLKRSGGVTTRFTWWGAQLLSETTDGPTASRTDYLYLPGTQRPLAMRRDGRFYFFQADHLDTPVRLVDSQGDVVWEGEPFGTEIRVLSQKIPQPLRFPGQYFDEETGLYYNVARYYQPATGRYITPDPLFNSGQTNPYPYARGNPALFVDPTGLIIPLIIGALVLGTVIGAAFAGAHQLSTNSIHGDPWDKNLGTALWHGAVAGLAGAAGAIVGGVIGFAAGGPVGAVVGAVAGGFVGASLASAGIAAAEAPDGEGWQACGNALIDSVPFVGSVRRFLDNPQDSQRGYQLLNDCAWDLLGVALIALGARKAMVRARAMQPAWEAEQARKAARRQPVKFKYDKPETQAKTEAVIDSFNKDGQGASVKKISLDGKSLGQIDSEIAGDGGWKTDPKTGKQVSQDGKWTKTEQVITKNPDGTPCTPYRMIFYENDDGGVVRLKPDGMPDAKFDHMKQPHGAKYVKFDPKGGTEFQNEAFKVDGDRAIPSTPKQLELPPGVKEGTPEAEQYIADNWKTPSHVPITK